MVKDLKNTLKKFNIPEGVTSEVDKKKENDNKNNKNKKKIKKNKKIKKHFKYLFYFLL